MVFFDFTKPEAAGPVAAAFLLSGDAQVTLVNRKERHSELAEESRPVHPRRRLARARFLGKLGMTGCFIRLLLHDY